MELIGKYYLAILLTTTLGVCVYAQSHYRTDETESFETDGPIPEGKWWGPGYCPHGEFAIGFKLESQNYRGSYSECALRKSDGTCIENPYGVPSMDDNGVTGLKLVCGQPKRRGAFKSESIIGYFPSNDERIFAELSGVVENESFCKSDFITGLVVRMQGIQWSGDDAAITNVKMKCGNGDIIGHSTDYDVGDRHQFKKDSCGKGQAVCGLMLKTEFDHFDDNTGLNEIKIYCCGLPDPRTANATLCNATVEWVEVASFINTGETSTKYTYTTKVGLSEQSGGKTTDKKFHSSGTDTSRGIEAELGNSFVTLKTKFEKKFSESKTVGEDKESSHLEIFGTERESKHEIVVESKNTVKVLQKIGKCGSYEVKSATFKREDECVKGFEEVCRLFKEKGNNYGAKANGTGSGTTDISNAAEVQRLDYLYIVLVLLFIFSLILILYITKVRVHINSCTTKVVLSEESGRKSTDNKSKSSGTDTSKGVDAELGLGPKVDELKKKFEQKFSEFNTLRKQRECSNLGIFGTEWESKQGIVVGSKNTVEMLQKIGPCGSVEVQSAIFKREDECFNKFEEVCRRFKV